MCVDGYYNPDIYDTDQCVICPAGEESAEEGTSCEPCQGTMTNLGDGGACSCPLRQEKNKFGDCVYRSCLAGQYVSHRGENTQYLDTGVTCSSCEEGHFQPVENILEQCYECNKGSYTAAIGASECTPCGVGTYTDMKGAHGCEECAENTYKPSISTDACEVCPTNTVSNAGSGSLSQCVCPNGYSALQDGMPCIKCEEGTYKNQPGAVECTICPYRKSSLVGSVLESDCKCKEGYYEDKGDCISCPIGTTSPFNTTNIERSLCMAVYSTLQDGMPCIECEAGTYKDQTGAVECTMCPYGKRSLIGSVIESDCKCIEGYYEDQGDCISCPVGTTSFFGATSKEYCLCMTGWILYGGECVPCPTGSYKSMIGIQRECKPC